LNKNFPLYLNVAAFLHDIFKPGSPDVPQREQNWAGKYIPGTRAINYYSNAGVYINKNAELATARLRSNWFHY
jgi:hypothetical protein